MALMGTQNGLIYVKFRIWAPSNYVILNVCFSIKPVHRSVLAENLAFYFALQQTFRNSGPLPPMIVEVCLCLSKHFIPMHV